MTGPGTVVLAATDQLVVPAWADLTAVAVVSLQASIAASRVSGPRRIDVVGIAFVGIVSGLGGGIVRDLLVGVTPVAMTGNRFLGTALVAALVGMLFAGVLNHRSQTLMAIDALGLGLFTVVGTQKAVDLGFGVVPAILVGVVTATGGSILRDLLLGDEVTVIRVGTFHAVAAAAGAIVFLGLDATSLARPAVGIAAGGLCAALRLLALRLGWTSPPPLTLPVDRMPLPRRTKPRQDD